MLIAPLVVAFLVGQTGKLEIVDTTVGTGTEAQIGDLVTVDYTGKLLNGKQFDSSVGRKPFTFQLGLGQVIKGWDQGVSGMKIGGVRQLTIPSDLAYGSQAMGDDIPANSTLKFEVKLISVEPRAKVEIVTKGTGPAAKLGDQVEVVLIGSLKDGKEFVSTKKEGEKPAKFVIGQRLLPGLTQALIGITKGEKRRVTIPAPLGYGARMVPPVDQPNAKAGSLVPANSTLIFDIEAISVTAPMPAVTGKP